MTHNLRWIVVLLGLAVVVYGCLLLRQSRAATDPAQHQRRVRIAVAAVLVGLAVAWVNAQVPPFRSWGRFPWSEFRAWLGLTGAPRALVACVAYLVIVVFSNRGLIGLPQFRLLQSRAEELSGLAQWMRKPEREAFQRRIAEASATAAIKIGFVVFSAPLTSMLRSSRTMNSIEIQMLFELDGEELRLAGRQIAAGLPSTKEGLVARAAILGALTRQTTSESHADGPVRDECVAALTLAHRLRDEPQAKEAARIRVAMWLTSVGLAAVYALSVTFDHLNDALVIGALGGLLGSLSALILRRELSLGLIVLSPVAGALNAVGGLLLVSFLARDEIQLLGQVFRDTWASPQLPTSLAVALLLGFSGGLFSRIAVAGVAPILGAGTPTPDEAKSGRPAVVADEDPLPALPPATAPAILEGAAQEMHRITSTRETSTMEVNLRVLPRRRPTGR